MSQSRLLRMRMMRINDFIKELLISQNLRVGIKVKSVFTSIMKHLEKQKMDSGAKKLVL